MNTMHKPRPALSIYHANGRGTGSAMTVALEPATPAHDGRLIFGLAPQSAGNAPTFDWAREIVFSLYFADVCEFLRLFRGETESIADGRGLFHRTTDANIRIQFRHAIEPANCYVLDVYKHFTDGEERRVSIALTQSEAVGLSLAIEHSMSLLAFGVHDLY